MAMPQSEYDDLLELIVDIDNSGVPLDAKDKRFLESQRARIERYKRDVDISPAQLQWLRDIHARVTQ